MTAILVLLGLIFAVLVMLGRQFETIGRVIKDNGKHLEQITKQLDDAIEQRGRIIWILRGEEDALDDIVNRGKRAKEFIESQATKTGPDNEI